MNNGIGPLEVGGASRKYSRLDAKGQSSFALNLKAFVPWEKLSEPQAGRAPCGTQTIKMELQGSFTISSCQPLSIF